MKNTTKQKRKRKLDPKANPKGRITGHIQYGQSNKMISTLRRLIQSIHNSQSE